MRKAIDRAPFATPRKMLKVSYLDITTQTLERKSLCAMNVLKSLYGDYRMNCETNMKASFYRVRAEVLNE